MLGSCKDRTPFSPEYSRSEQPHVEFLVFGIASHVGAMGQGPLYLGNRAGIGTTGISFATLVYSSGCSMTFQSGTL